MEKAGKQRNGNITQIKKPAWATLGNTFPSLMQTHH